MSGVPPQLQLRLLDLQQLDSRADALDQQWRSHPSVQAIIDLTASLDALQAELDDAERAVTDARTQVRDAEREAEQIKAKQDKDRSRLDAGQVSSPRELQSLQHEIATLQQLLDEVETRELEAMEQLDEAESTLGGLRSQVADLAAQRQGHEDDLARARQGIDVDRDALAGERSQVAAELPDDLLARYERSRAQHGGVGVGALRNGRCEGCRLALTPADLARAKTAAPDELLRCEECGRLLVRVDD